MDSLLFTGASGFLGRNILPILRRNYCVTTLGIAFGDDIQVNLAEDVPDIPVRCNIVLHAAGLAHKIAENDADEQEFYRVNLDGTKHLCEGLLKAGVPDSFIFISSVAVYGCDSGSLIDETHELAGTTAYARSKILAEEYITEWCEEQGIVLTILRPALIVGLNPPGNLGDMIRGIRRGFYVNIGGGKAHKSLLMAEDIANLIPLVAPHGGIYNVCDSDNPSFGELSRSIARQLGKHGPISIPEWLASAVAHVGNLIGGKFPLNTARLDKITQSLTFSNRKAITDLGWTPLGVLDTFKVKP